MADTYSNVDEYIASFPPEVKTILERIRETVHEVVPEGEEVISYQIPTIKVDGKYLVYFAGWKEHVSLYPLPKSETFAEELAPYKSGKGTAKFRIDKPIPYDLIERLVTQLAEERPG